MSKLRLLLGTWVLSFVLLGCSGSPQATSDPDPSEMAGQLLDEEIDVEERRSLAEAHPEHAPAILYELTSNLESGTEEEARRIPWIWRVTINATQKNDEIIRELIEIGLPERNEPLLNWQGVVLGGGIVNGISREGGWPEERIADILSGYEALHERWQRAVDLSYEMAADPEVEYPWRYDALRMVAMDAHDESIPELISYLESDRDDHLHMGAISGLSDVRSPRVSEPLIEGLPHFSDRNRNLAFDALLRTRERTAYLLDAIEEGRIEIEELGEARLEQLRNHENESIRHRIEVLDS